METPQIYNKEDIYDSEISPLITQIIAICKKHKIPMIASFTYENDEEKGFGRCTTHLKYEGREDEVNHQAHGIIRGGGHQAMVITTTSTI